MKRAVSLSAAAAILSTAWLTAQPAPPSSPLSIPDQFREAVKQFGRI